MKYPRKAFRLLHDLFSNIPWRFGKVETTATLGDRQVDDCVMFAGRLGAIWTGVCKSTCRKSSEMFFKCLHIFCQRRVDDNVGGFFFLLQRCQATGGAEVSSPSTRMRRSASLRFLILRSTTGLC